jgi:anti-sigma regulatory factor (Ser/Thr protein kinase)
MQARQQQSQERHLRLAERERRRLYRRILLAATGGRLVLLDGPSLRFVASHGKAVGQVQLHTTEDLQACRDLADRASELAGLSEDRVRDVRVALGEACSNALVHGGAGRVSARILPRALRIYVSDKGRGIPPEHLTDAALIKGWSSRQANLGVGFSVMHELADRVYLSTGPRGTCVVLEFYTHRRSVRPFIPTDRPHRAALRL